MAVRCFTSVKINAPLLSDKIVEEKKEDGYKSLLNDLWDKLEGSGDPEEPSRWELEELASSDAVDEIKIDSIPA